MNSIKLSLIILTGVFITNMSIAQCLSSFTYTIGASGEVTFTNTSPFPMTSTWVFGDGTTSFDTHPIHTFTSNGTYDVCLTITSQPMCADTSCQTITITNATVSLPTLGLINNISIFPNPFQESFEVSFDQTETDVTIQLVDITGKIILTQHLNNSSSPSLIKLDEFQLKKGVYFLNFLVDNNYSNTLKVVKQ